MTHVIENSRVSCPSKSTSTAAPPSPWPPFTSTAQPYVPAMRRASSAARAALPARVVFVGTLPPSVPGIRTQHQLQRRYGVLGGTYLMGDEVVSARMDENRVLSVSTKNLGSHVLSADSFVLSSGAFFSKGLLSTPEHVYEPLFKLDVVFAEERSGWYRPDFMEDQPYLSFGVRTDADLRALKGGRPVENLYAMGPPQRPQL